MMEESLKQMVPVKSINISLKEGVTLTLDMSDLLVDKIIDAFSLSGPDEITDRHVKYYLVSSLKKVD